MNIAIILLFANVSLLVILLILALFIKPKNSDKSGRVRQDLDKIKDQINGKNHKNRL